MFAFVLALVVAGHGDAGSREEKFRGALLAEARAPTVIDRAATERELHNLIENRPDLMPATVTMCIGGAFTLLGLTSFAVMAAAGVSSFAGIIFLIVGAVAVPGGLIVSLVAGLMMITVAVDRGVYDQRIRLLKGRLEQPVEPPPPPPSVFAPSPSLLLARF